MKPDAMTAYGLALLAYHQGQTSAEMVVRRDDGFEVPLPAAYFFRQEAQLSPIEAAALERCRGLILDVGAGGGQHSLILQSRGLAVTAIDISPDAVTVMTERGVRLAQQADVFEYRDGPFDTLLLIGHGIGMAEDLAGLGRFLAHARKLVRAGGQILLDSLDVSRTDDPRNLAYQEANRQQGRYVGETRIQIEFQEKRGPFCGWLHADASTLARHAEGAGWGCETVLDLPSGEYLARLVPLAG
jgi:SAM-dependent methyltransferase